MQIIDIPELWDTFKISEYRKKYLVPKYIIDKLNDLLKDSYISTRSPYRICLRNDEHSICIYRDNVNSSTIEVDGEIYIYVNRRIYDIISDSNAIPRLAYNKLIYGGIEDKELMEDWYGTD